MTACAVYCWGCLISYYTSCPYGVGMFRYRAELYHCPQTHAVLCCCRGSLFKVGETFEDMLKAESDGQVDKMMTVCQNMTAFVIVMCCFTSSMQCVLSLYCRLKPTKAIDELNIFS